MNVRDCYISDTPEPQPLCELQVGEARVSIIVHRTGEGAKLHLWCDTGRIKALVGRILPLTPSSVFWASCPPQYSGQAVRGRSYVKYGPQIVFS